MVARGRPIREANQDGAAAGKMRIGPGRSESAIIVANKSSVNVRYAFMVGISNRSVAIWTLDARSYNDNAWRLEESVNLIKGDSDRNRPAFPSTFRCYKQFGSLSPLKPAFSDRIYYPFSKMADLDRLLCVANECGPPRSTGRRSPICLEVLRE